MSDDEVRSMTYADLWLAELGGTVPEHHDGEAPRPGRRPWQLREEVPAPDPTRRPTRA